MVIGAIHKATSFSFGSGDGQKIPCHKQFRYINYNMVSFPRQEGDATGIDRCSDRAKKYITPKNLLQNGNFLIYYTQRKLVQEEECS
jgi:hypothetical protein